MSAREMLNEVLDGADRFPLTGARWIAVERNCAGGVWLYELATQDKINDYLANTAADNESPHDYLPWLLLDTHTGEWRPLILQAKLGKPITEPHWCGKLDDYWA